MRSQKIALSLILSISSCSFAGTLLTKESATTIQLKIDYISFKKDKAIESLGKFSVNGRDITCSMGEQKALEADVTIKKKDLSRVTLISHFPDKGVLDFSVSGETNSDMPVQMQCKYQATPGKTAAKAPLSVEDLQGYFNSREKQQKMITDGLRATLGVIGIFMPEKLMYKMMPNYFGFDHIGSAGSYEKLTEETNPQMCPNPNREEKLSDKILQRCTAYESPHKTVIFKGHAQADGSNQPAGQQ